MAGTLYGIGVGPGDPELMTLKAVRLTAACPVAAVPGKNGRESVAYRIARQAVPELEQKEVCGIDLPMTRDAAVLAQKQREGAARIERWLEEGKDVAFLTLGDVTVYSTCLYICRLVKADGYRTCLVNGVPSFCAAAARLDMGLAQGAGQLHVLPASCGIGQALELKGTKVLMKAGSRLAEVREQLLSRGMDAALVENCGMEDERVWTSLREADQGAGYYSLMIISDEKGGTSV